MEEQVSIVVRIFPVALSPHRSIYLSPRIIKDLGLRQGLQDFSFGGTVMPIQLFEDPMIPRKKGPALYCSEDVLFDLRIPEETTMHLYVDENKLRLGPVLGIMAKIKRLSKDSTSQQEPIFQRLLEAAEKEHVFAYVFSPDHVDFKNRRIQGYRFEKVSDKKEADWKLRDFPFPDVIYDQIVTRKFEKLPEVQSVKKRLMKTVSNRYFNPGFFDKWEVHEWLSSDKKPIRYVPATRLYDSVERAVQFISLYPSVYIKPIHGSLGVGIIKVERLADGRYEYFIRSRKGISNQGIAYTPLKAIQSIRKRLVSKKYVLQQGLSLLTYHGRPFDVRILVQKDDKGQWAVTKSFCRIIKQGDITSNISTGGEAKPLRAILQEVIHEKEKRKRILSDIKQLSQSIPSMLEKQSGKTIGELGLDVGIDMNGKIWIIEINSKPWKKSDTEVGSMKYVLLSFQRPVEFSKYLAGVPRKVIRL